MPVQLVGLTEGFKIIVDKPILLLGRDSECDIQFDSRKISRRHCCVAQVGEQLLVRDLGSTNGIRINGIRVVEGYLKEGDELTVGNHRYIVRWDSLPSAPAREEESHRPPRAPVPSAPAHMSPDDGILEASEEPIPFADNAPPGARLGGLPGRDISIPNVPQSAPADGDSLLPDDSPIPGLLTPDLGLAPISEDIPALSPRKPPPKDAGTS